ncbi:MAG: acetate--CoA ligase family protein [Bacteroidota bacterium]
MTARPPDIDAARRLLTDARRAGVGYLELDAKLVLGAIGIPTPARIALSGPAGAEGLADPPFPGRHVVLKALAPGLLHKTEAGAVRILPSSRDLVVAEMKAMTRRLDGLPIGFLLEECVRYDASLGHEFLVGLRWTPDFGPVVSVGAGGLHAERLAGAFKEEEALAVFSPALACGGSIERSLERVAAVRLATRSQRGRAPLLAVEALADIVRRLLALGEAVPPELLLELEVNPLAVSDGRLVALDALAIPARGPVLAAAAPRPIEKIERLLSPGSVALVGVSDKGMNPGRIILRNVLRAGFDPARVVVVKPGAAALDGVRCVPSLADLPDEPAFHGGDRRADLVVLSISAPVSAALVEQIARDRRAESVILIPGGLEEHQGSGEIVARMREAIERSRATSWRGPVVNGGNCLGVRSAPGSIDTFFIPGHKLPVPERAPDPIAFIAGSGAFAVSKSSKLDRVNPVYTITIGNQTDLTVADYLEYLKSDPRVDVFAVYLEGFRPLDGARFLTAAQAITAMGKSVVLYRGGRTSAGRDAASSHTAAIAGNYAVTRALAREAGVVVAESLEEFEDLVRLFAMLRERSVSGFSLGAVSNAGYESVAIADRLGPFRLASFAEATGSALRDALERSALDGIVSVRNPLDVTPILDDAGYEAVARAILDDPGVDVGVIGCVPLTGALQTLPPAPEHAEDLARPEALAPRLLRLAGERTKAWVAVVDAGGVYDPLARALEAGGVPVFRSADRAMRVFGRYCAARLRHGGPAGASLPEVALPERHVPEPVPGLAPVRHVPGTEGVHGSEQERAHWPEPELVFHSGAEPESELVGVGGEPLEPPHWGVAIIWS